MQHGLAINPSTRLNQEPSCFEYSKATADKNLSLSATWVWS